MTLLFLLRRLQAPARHSQGRSGNRINKIHICTLINEDLHEVEIRLVASDVQRATSTTPYNVNLSFLCEILHRFSVAGPYYLADRRISGFVADVEVCATVDEELGDRDGGTRIHAVQRRVAIIVDEIDLGLYSISMRKTSSLFLSTANCKGKLFLPDW